MMNRKERVMTVLQGGKPDRTPVCFWHHFGNLEPAETVKAHLRWLEESGQDILKMMCDEFFVYPLGDADTPEAYAALKPQGRDSYYVRGQVERATQINEALKGEVVTFYNAFSPYATLKHAIGQDRAMDLMRKHPDAARHLLDIIEEDTVYIIEGILKESGTTGMMLCLQGAEEGLFTDEEYEKMKLHAAEGARVIHEILRNTDDEAFKTVAENVAHYHHERWDGSGYPEGLSGEQIPIEARIMAIADVYDALVSKRVYKEAFDFEKANRIILEGMGTQFDQNLQSAYEKARPRLEAYYGKC